MLLTPAVLAVLVEDRRCGIVRDFAFARREGLRRSAAGFIHRLGAGITALGNALDEEPGTVRA